MKTQSFELSAACMGMTVEQFKKTYCGENGRKQGRLAVSAIRNAMNRNTKGAIKALSIRTAITKAKGETL